MTKLNLVPPNRSRVSQLAVAQRRQSVGEVLKAPAVKIAMLLGAAHQKPPRHTTTRRLRP